MSGTNGNHGDASGKASARYHDLPPLPADIAAWMHSEAPRDYTLVIPGRIMRMALPLPEKALLAVIDGLHRNGRGCFASNSYLSERVSVSTREISRLIQNLEDKGYVSARHFRDPERIGGRVRLLAPTDHVPLTTPETPPREGMDNAAPPPSPSVVAPVTSGGGGLDKTARHSRQGRACLESLSESEVEREVEGEQQQQQTSRAPAHEAQPLQTAAAAERPHAQEPAPDTAPPLPYTLTPEELHFRDAARAAHFERTTAALLALGCDNEIDAERYARQHPLFIDEYLEQARRLPLTNRFGWLRKRLDELAAEHERARHGSQ